MPTTPQGRPAAMTRTTTGAAAGAAATAAMSVLMAGWRTLLGGGRLGPARVTDRTLAPVGLLPEGRTARRALQSAAHLGFGSTVGAGYALSMPPLLRAVPVLRAAPAPARGAAYGLAVWAATYGRTLPALGIMPAPSQDRPGRQPRLVVAHIVYGAVLGALCDRRGKTGGRAWT